MYSRCLLFWLFAVVALVPTLTIDARSAAAGQHKHPYVAFINPGITGEVFWTLVSRTMQAAADQLDIDLTIDYAERNRVRMKQLAMATILGSRKPDAIILVNEEQAGVELMEAADARGITVLMLLNDVVGDERRKIGRPGTRHKNWIGSIVPDNRSAGRRMAHKLEAFAYAKSGSEGEAGHPLVALYGDTITPASIDRNGGLQDVLDSGATHLVMDHALIADWNRDKARTLMDRVLKHYARMGPRRPVAVWAANDPIALGAIDALRANGLEPGRDVGVVGLNWSPEALDAIDDGLLLMSDGGHFFGGAWAMVVLRDFFDGHPVAATDGVVHFAMSPIDKSNIDNFRKNIGDIIVRNAFDEIDYRHFLLGSNNEHNRYDFSSPAIVIALNGGR